MSAIGTHIVIAAIVNRLLFIGTLPDDPHTPERRLLQS
jgi:hypothetical protein